MNLIKDPWIPIQRKNGAQDLIAPWQVTEHLGTEKEVVSLSAPRSDFDAALIQFLIGLLQTTMTPNDESSWNDSLAQPPTSDVLKQAFLRVAHAFETKGDNPRFMQDFDVLDVKSSNAISYLLIDAPATNTIKENKDHFVKRGQVNAMCPACAMTALLTLQMNAPSGGQGHRTSMRGGGPLTTLIVNDVNNSGLPDTLWTNLWLNILDKHRETMMTGDWLKKEDKDTFPWLAKTHTSEKNTGREVFPEDTHPDQVYWSMPRRIRIVWDKTVAGHCGICNVYFDELVTHYETKNYGINYSGAWQHPLSPHYIDKKGEILPCHAQPGGVNYRHWLNFIKNTDNFLAAFVVKRYPSMISGFTQGDREQFRLRTFGYDMDNMKARCWYEATFPLYELKDQDGVDLSINIETLTTAATDVSGFVSSCIKEAWFRRPSDVRGDASFLKDAFFQQTEKKFYQAVKQLIDTDGTIESDIKVLNFWHKVLIKVAYKLFDYWSNNGDFAQSDPKRIAKAYVKLRKLLRSKKLLGLLQVPSKKRRLLNEV
jgi:CRISPR system Cascade subunit CasA